MEKMKDLIDRRALIKEFSDFVRASNNSDFTPMPTWNDAVSLVESMPPVQPSSSCAHENDQDLQSTCNKLATDCISRQQAIDALDKEYRCTDRSDDWDGLRTAMLIIENLPSAKPRLNKKRISDLLWDEYRTMSPHLSAEGVVARRYYCKELWKELFGEEETPIWMTW